MSAGALAQAVIAAAGSGERLGAGGPKALVELGGRPLLAWSLDSASAAQLLESVVVAAPPGHEVEVAEIAPGATVVEGGASRSESVSLALEHVSAELVAVHDAARPLATPELFDRLIAELSGDDGCDAIVAAAPVADTLKRALAGRVIETVPRSELWAAQTPQVFRTQALRAALAADRDVLAIATDDASLVEEAGGVVRVYPWDRANPKLTTSEDLRLLEALLSG